MIPGPHHRSGPARVDEGTQTFIALPLPAPILCAWPISPVSLCRRNQLLQPPVLCIAAKLTPRLSPYICITVFSCSTTVPIDLARMTLTALRPKRDSGDNPPDDLGFDASKDQSNPRSRAHSHVISIDDIDEDQTDSIPARSSRPSTFLHSTTSSEIDDDTNDFLSSRPVLAQTKHRRSFGAPSTEPSRSHLSLDSGVTDSDNSLFSHAPNLVPVDSNSRKRRDPPDIASKEVQKRRRHAVDQLSIRNSHPSASAPSDLSFVTSSLPKMQLPAPAVQPNEVIDLSQICDGTKKTHPVEKIPDSVHVHIHQSTNPLLNSALPTNRPALSHDEIQNHTNDSGIQAVRERRTRQSSAPNAPAINNDVRLAQEIQLTFNPDVSLTNRKLVNILTLLDNNGSAWDRFIFFSHRPQRFNFESNTYLSTLSPFTAVTSRMKSASVDDVCAVCGAGARLLACVRCTLAFHPNCVDPAGMVRDRRNWMCVACRSTKINDSTISWKVTNPPPPLPSPATGFPRLIMDAREGNPIDFVMHPSLVNFYEKDAGADWLKCVRCGTIRDIGLGVLSESLHIPFDCSKMFWVDPQDQVCPNPSLPPPVESLALKNVRLYLSMRSRMRAALFYHYMGEEDREQFGFEPVAYDVEPDDFVSKKEEPSHQTTSIATGSKNTDGGYPEVGAAVLTELVHVMKDGSSHNLPKATEPSEPDVDLPKLSEPKVNAAIKASSLRSAGQVVKDIEVVQVQPENVPAHNPTQDSTSDDCDVDFSFDAPIYSNKNVEKPEVGPHRLQETTSGPAVAADGKQGVESVYANHADGAVVNRVDAAVGNRTDPLVADGTEPIVVNSTYPNASTLPHAIERAGSKSGCLISPSHYLGLENESETKRNELPVSNDGRDGDGSSKAVPSHEIGEGNCTPVSAAGMGDRAASRNGIVDPRAEDGGEDQSNKVSLIKLITSMGLELSVEDRLMDLALGQNAALLSLHAAVGTSKETHEKFKRHALRLIAHTNIPNIAGAGGAMALATLGFPASSSVPIQTSTSNMGSVGMAMPIPMTNAPPTNHQEHGVSSQFRRFRMNQLKLQARTYEKMYNEMAAAPLDRVTEVHQNIVKTTKSLDFTQREELKWFVQQQQRGQKQNRQQVPVNNQAQYHYSGHMPQRMVPGQAMHQHQLHQHQLHQLHQAPQQLATAREMLEQQIFQQTRAQVSQQFASRQELQAQQQLHQIQQLQSQLNPQLQQRFIQRQHQHGHRHN